MSSFGPGRPGLATAPRWMPRTSVIYATAVGLSAGAIVIGHPAARTAVAVCIFGVAALIDLRSRRIPNWLTAGGMSFALVSAGAGWSSAVAGTAIALLVGIVLVIAARGGFGMGDVKLLGVAGALVGPGPLPVLLLLVSVAGGLLSAFHLIRHRGDAKGLIAYGPAISAGSVITLLTLR